MVVPSVIMQINKEFSLKVEAEAFSYASSIYDREKYPLSFECVKNAYIRGYISATKYFEQ
jgi:hypothetical protein